jgi:hypothetical protein
VATDNSTKAEIEGVKLVCDFFKHLTTLSTGSIVVIAAFSQRVQPLHWRALAATAIGGFVVSILGAILASGILVFRAEQGNFTATGGMEQILESLWLLVAFVSFFVALLSLAIFAARNFFP